MKAKTHAHPALPQPPTRENIEQARNEARQRMNSLKPGLDNAKQRYDALFNAWDQARSDADHFQWVLDNGRVFSLSDTTTT